MKMVLFKWEIRIRKISWIFSYAKKSNV